MNLKAPLCATALSLLVSISWGQQAKSTPAPTPLTPEQQTKIKETIGEAQKLIGERHFFEALQKVDDAQAIAPDLPMLWNVRGSIFTDMRDFPKAKEAFTKALELDPKGFEAQFNLSELLFVDQKYADAEAAFSNLQKTFPKLRENIRHYVRFKVVVCRLKQDKVKEAKQAMSTFTSKDDTPAYYYSQAAVAFQANKETDAQTWLDKAARIYKPSETNPYTDCLMEARWIKSFTVPDH